MSVWMHVNASFRLDSFEPIKDSDIIEFFGKVAVHGNGLEKIKWDKNGNVKNKHKYLPLGSEGTLDMSVWHNPHKSCIASTTVNVFGDLRDRENPDEIERWFNKCCDKCRDKYRIRQAVCQINWLNQSKVFVCQE